MDADAETNWMSVRTDVVSGGQWNGQRPASENIDIIRRLKNPLIPVFVEEEAQIRPSQIQDEEWDEFEASFE